MESSRDFHEITMLVSYHSRYSGHYGPLASLGLPIIIGQLGIILVSFADTMMVGHYRTSDLAAASFVNNVFNLVIIFSTGFSYGLTPIVGRLFGKEDFQGVGRMLKNSLAANSLIAVLLMLFMTAVYLNVDRLGQPAELLPLIRPYFLVLLASLLPVLLFNAFKQFADGITDTVTPMWILLLSNVVNIFGNWCLIFGKLGCPEMGLLGAGISTLVSRILTVIVFAGIFFFSKKYAPYREGFLRSSVNRRDFRTLNRLGWPVGLQMGMETGSFSLATIMVGWLGTLALAAHQVMLTVGQLGFMLYYGMAAAIAVRTSHFLGQGDIRNVRDSASAGFQLILLMAAVVSSCIFAFRHSIGGVFSENHEVAAVVAQLVIPFIIYQFGDGLQCAYSNALRGISDVRPVVLIAFIAYFAVSLPAGYIFGFVCGWGLTGIWMSFPLGLTTAGILYWLRFQRTIRKIS